MANQLIDQEQKAPEDENSELTGAVETPSDQNDYMSEWGRRANALSEKTWKYCQIAMGTLLGLGCGACLIFFESEGFLPLNLVLAFLIAKIGPDLIEKWFERKARTTRLAVIITLAAALVAYVIYNLVLGKI